MNEYQYNIALLLKTVNLWCLVVTGSSLGGYKRSYLAILMPFFDAIFDDSVQYDPPISGKGLTEIFWRKKTHSKCVFFRCVFFFGDQKIFFSPKKGLFLKEKNTLVMGVFFRIF